MMLHGENFSRARAVFNVTFTFRAALPPGDDHGIGYEIGDTRETKYVLAPSASLAGVAAIHRWGSRHEFHLEDVSFSAFQLDLAIDVPVDGGKL